MGARGSRYEVSTVGFDENLQLVGNDPLVSPYNVGLRVPSSPTTFSVPSTRYLFMLARAKFQAHERARLVGVRQLATIGTPISNGNEGSSLADYILEKQITSPFWRFQDGSISWHILRSKPGLTVPSGNPLNIDSVMFRDSDTPALLYETYTAPFAGGGNAITAYVPPFGGRPLPNGDPLTPDLGGFHDIRYPWNAGQFDDIDIEIEGPCTISFYASVKQTDPASRTLLVVPASLPGGVDSIPAEDAFVANFVDTIYWRVAGALIFERASLSPVAEHNPMSDGGP